MAIHIPPALVTAIAAETGRDPSTVRRAIANIESGNPTGTSSTTKAVVERSLVRRGLMPRREHASKAVSRPHGDGGSHNPAQAHHVAPSEGEQ